MAWASPPEALDITLDASRQRVDISDGVDYLEDARHALDRAGVSQPAVASQFRPWPAGAGTINFGHTESSYWLRVVVQVAPGAPRRWLLEIPFALLDEIDLYLDGEPAQRAGNERAGFIKPYTHRLHLFALDLPPGPHVIYLRVRSVYALTVPLTLWQEYAFQAHAQWTAVLQSLYFGGLFALLVYNLFLALALRDTRFVYYSFFALQMGMVMFVGNGYAQIFLWPQHAWLNGPMQYFFLGMVAATGVAFNLRFLQVCQWNPALAWLMKMGIWLMVILSAGCLGGLAYPALGPQIIVPLTWVAVIGGLLAVISSAQAYRRGQAPALFLLLAWLVVWSGGTVAALRAFGWVPTNAYTSYSLQISSALEMLLMAFALADLIHSERNEKEAAQARLLQMQQRLVDGLRESEERLESLVRQRTRELDLALQTERGIRERFVRFGALISHEFRNPLAIAQSQISLMRDGPARGNPALTRGLDTMASAIHRLLALFEKWLQSDRLDRGLDAFNPQPLALHAWLAELVDAQREYHAEHVLRYEPQADPGEVWVDEAMLEIVVLNLLDNACRYSASGTAVVISLELREEDASASYAGISVADQGIGIRPQDQPRVFEDYFRAAPESDASGLGLGLSFARRIAQIHGGMIELTSAPGVGSRFCIWLPLGASPRRDR